MGQYYRVINITKKQSISPYAVGNGLDLGDCWEPLSGIGEVPEFRSAVEKLVDGPWKNDGVALVGDEGDIKILSGRKHFKTFNCKYYYEKGYKFERLNKRDITHILRGDTVQTESKWAR